MQCASLVIGAASKFNSNDDAISAIDLLAQYVITGKKLGEA